MALPSTPAPRPQFDWRLRTRTLPLGAHTVLMAILNVTPDSFSDGSHFNNPARAIDRALYLLDHGAHLLDLGGESTRPHATPITPDEEQSRVLPILEAILRDRPDAILSIDTFHAATAHRALAAGAEIVNDVSGFTWDPAMAATCAAEPSGIVLMHTRGRPQDWPTLPPMPREQILPTVLSGLAACVERATAAGISPNHIVLDPGFGFGKLGKENYTLLAHLAELRPLNFPLLAGISRKGFLARSLAPFYHGLPAPIESRVLATQAANVAAILAGAHILRVHDLAAAQQAAAIADDILTYA